MLALHARRSAEAVLAWHTQRGACGLGRVLTGTDLYRDIEHDTSAQRSLALAASLVVLNPLGLRALPAPHRDRARVILQSTTTRQVLPKSARRLRAVMVGHLRAEKDPPTLMAAARQLPADAGIHITWLLTCRGDPAQLARLQVQCAQRAPLFDPAAEQAALHRWVHDLWNH